MFIVRNDVGHFLTRTQYTYMKSRSVEMEIFSAVSDIKISLRYGKHAQRVLLGIKRVFNNIRIEA